jgi:aerobic-type carbon monoxide dehydrogenase small subunit (CoxS/CutS family)
VTGVTEQVITVSVNGRSVDATVPVRTLLSDFLRGDLGLTGTHVACEHGVCGACTVLVDDEPVRACLMLAVQVDGRRLDTVEGLADGESMSALQESMRTHHGLQCGFCTPGILMTVEGARRAGDSLESALDDGLSGHLCRCTGYQNIRTAIEAYYGEVGRG